MAYVKLQCCLPFDRIFDGADRLVLAGRYSRGLRVGRWWHQFPSNGGHLLTRVAAAAGDGEIFDDDEAVYVYPDFRTCLVGRFRDGVMDATAIQGTVTAWRLAADGLPELDIR